MAATLTAASPGLVDSDGGIEITLTGSFVAGRAYKAFVGTDTQGKLCYSGVSGQGPLCLAASATALSVVIPPCAEGDVPLCVLDTVDGSTQTGSGILRAEAPFLSSVTFALRRDIRPILDVGPTDPSQLPDAQPVPGFVP